MGVAIPAKEILKWLPDFTTTKSKSLMLMPWLENAAGSWVGPDLLVNKRKIFLTFRTAVLPRLPRTPA